MTQHRQTHAQRRSAGEGAGDANFLLFDGECPACSAYVAMSRLRQLYPGLRVMSARSEAALVAELRGRGYEINEGMVLCLDGVIHFGPDATRMIAVLGRSSPSRWRRTALAAVGTAPWARRLYPWLNRTRLLLLRTLGRKPIG
jgi:predicted DCC family thiol-disulfide oxidoreductase YuxK